MKKYATRLVYHLKRLNILYRASITNTNPTPRT